MGLTFTRVTFIHSLTALERGSGRTLDQGRFGTLPLAATLYTTLYTTL